MVPAIPALEELPRIDVVVISHNHYDHLDQDSVRRLAEQPGGAPRFFVPLGIKDWFARIGVHDVTEMGWWDRTELKGLEIHFVPSQHWSKRKLTDTNQTLWGGWVVRHPELSFFFAGDSGYSPDFADIGAKFGGFDLAAIPIGAYAPRWFMQIMHLDPAEAVRVHQDVNARQSLAIAPAPPDMQRHQQHHEDDRSYREIGEDRQRAIPAAGELPPPLVELRLRQVERAPDRDIEQTYSRLCGGCHGDDGRGTQQGPALDRSVNVLRWVGRTIQRVRNRLRRRSEPLRLLPDRLIRERDRITGTLGPRWKRALAATSGRWALDYATLLAALAAVGSTPRPTLVLLAFCAAQLLAQVPVTPGGLGFVEAGLTATLALAGVSAGDALLATFAYRLFSYWLPLPLGLLGAGLHRRGLDH